MTIPGSSLGAAVDLTNCDREPIHLLGAIQPFGFLLAVSTHDWFVQRVSSNVAEWLKVAIIPGDVLLVEDNFIIALDAEDALRRVGARQIRTANSVTSALELIDERLPEFAVLDVNLGIETSFEIAIRLLALGVPFAFMTGYGESEAFPDELAHVPRIRKPFTHQSLAAVLGRRR